MKINTRVIRAFKRQQQNRFLQMLTCYDYQTACMLNQTDLDLILVGDSLGNVILGYDTTVPVQVDEMILFGRAVKKGAPQKFVVIDLPFGSYFSVTAGLQNAIKVFQATQAEAVKLEGASDIHLQLIQELSHTGIPCVAHIGLTPQSVHAQGGYYTHGKNAESANQLLESAERLQAAGAIAIVLECIDEPLAAKITANSQIPTIGIGSGQRVDGQVLVINDLLGMGENLPPSFCKPLANFYQQKKQIIENYLDSFTGGQHE